MATNLRLSEKVMLDAAEHSRWAARMEQQVYMLGNILATLSLPANRLMAKTDPVKYATGIDKMGEDWYNRHKELLMVIDGYDTQTKNGETKDATNSENLSR